MCGQLRRKATAQCNRSVSVLSKMGCASNYLKIGRDDSDTAKQQYVTGSKLHLIVFSLTLACFLMTFSSSVLATAIPPITSEFHSVEDIGWYGSAYLLSNTHFFVSLQYLNWVHWSAVCQEIQGCDGSGILNGALTILAAAAPISKRSNYQRSFAYGKRSENAADFLGDDWVFNYSRELVSRLGYFTPWAIMGCVCSAVGSECMSLFNVNTGAGEWIGFQIFVGAGRGMVSQMPIIAIQNSLPTTDIAIGSSLATFSGYFGSAIFLSFASTIFPSSLTEELAICVPSIDVEAIVASGDTGLRDLVTGAELERVLIAYNESLIRCFYLAAGALSVAFLCSFELGWGTVKKKKKKKKKKNEKRGGDQESCENPDNRNSPESGVHSDGRKRLKALVF
ncbi:uncharacterized protein EAE97_007733 [Botrytis byssoidea]|uniref:Major facilitator superfamily (MFS) profile domain-containing protein n=1 Tax=Botrytis byssoidea TaxID=139641 RepID=A0A9P5LW72_9HELO|nr:uncharacterized protein EAE97_007733 [Botrytis byssoidea]KAF7937937.1 hypothetical protein EAE97_007733 [Botrytis byssoidea]